MRFSADVPAKIQWDMTPPNEHFGGWSALNVGIVVGLDGRELFIPANALPDKMWVALNDYVYGVRYSFSHPTGIKG